ncbi:Uma2 family endonuclease [Meiothermus sp. Pnk-1]|uniref:Uma2 family endonuclease n=1 Tax=Meiothermus sp. Pnk-1 TaxID=873128 RepID=UPI000D7BFE2B|nr:Uma2 family endonuclease [Meiothermus sp. Pnk-1]PZA09006.1 Uma2 family endonuclease [Meiothermus sp. Pnk-1]
MGEAAKVLTRLGFEEYLAAEEKAKVKHELVDGVMYAMAGASDIHNRISGNIFARIWGGTRGSPCRVYMSDMKLKIDNWRSYYPDVMVVCADDPHPYYKESPCLIVEVLSETTEVVDRREKLEHYRRIPSLEAYLLVDSRVRRAEGYYRQGEQWLYTEVVGAGEVRVPCPSLRLSLEEIYEGIELPDRLPEDPDA